MPLALELQQQATELAPTRDHRHMTKVLESLAKMYELFYNASYFFDQDELAELKHHMDRMAKHYQVLQVQALAQGKAKWKSTVKMHYVAAHIHAQAQVVNPRFVQGYASESLVGQICGIYAGSQSGPFHGHIQRMCFLKYRTGLKLLWEQ